MNNRLSKLLNLVVVVDHPFAISTQPRHATSISGEDSFRRVTTEGADFSVPPGS